MEKYLFFIGLVIIFVFILLIDGKGSKKVSEIDAEELRQKSIRRLRDLYETTLPRMLDILSDFVGLIKSIKKRGLPIETESYVKLAARKETLVRRCLVEYRDLVYNDNLSQFELDKLTKLFACLLCDYDKMIKDLLKQRQDYTKNNGE